VTSVLIVAGPRTMIATLWPAASFDILVMVVVFWIHVNWPPGNWSISRETVPPWECAPQMEYIIQFSLLGTFNVATVLLEVLATVAEVTRPDEYEAMTVQRLGVKYATH